MRRQSKSPRSAGCSPTPRFLTSRDHTCGNTTIGLDSTHE
jgi:hypothetical protein